MCTQWTLHHNVEGIISLCKITKAITDLQYFSFLTVLVQQNILHCSDAVVTFPGSSHPSFVQTRQFSAKSLDRHSVFLNHLMRCSNPAFLLIFSPHSYSHDTHTWTGSWLLDTVYPGFFPEMLHSSQSVEINTHQTKQIAGSWGCCCCC